MNILEYKARLLGGTIYLQLSKFCLIHNIFKNYFSSQKSNYLFWKWFNIPMYGLHGSLKEIGTDWNPYVCIRYGNSKIPFNKWDPESDCYIKDRKIYDRFKKAGIIKPNECFKCRWLFDYVPSIPLRVIEVDKIEPFTPITDEEANEFLKELSKEISENDKDSSK